MQVVFVRSCISGCVTAFTTRRAASATPSSARRTRRPRAGKRFPRRRRPAAWAIHIHDRDPPGPSAVLAPVPPASVMGSIAFSLAYVSLTYLTVGDSVAIFFLNPIFSSLMAIPASYRVPSGRRHRRRARRHPAHRQAPGAVPRPERRRSTPRSTDGSGGGGVTLFSAFFCAVAMVSIRATRVGSARSPSRCGFTALAALPSASRARGRCRPSGPPPRGVC